MDATEPSSDASSPRSRPLQGKRPPLLAVNADSLKIKKPIDRRQKPRPKKSHHLQQPPRRAPVISYASTKEPGDFKAFVQRLTGPVAAAPDSMEMESAGPSSVVSSPLVKLLSPREWLLFRCPQKLSSPRPRG